MHSAVILSPSNDYSSSEQKSTMVHLLQQSIREQQEIYTRPSAHPLGTANSTITMQPHDTAYMSESMVYPSTGTDADLT